MNYTRTKNQNSIFNATFNVLATFVSFAFLCVSLTGCGSDLLFGGDGNKPGSNGVLVKESLSVSDLKKPVDIIFIVDNSHSMAREQRQMSEKFQSFIDDLSGVDWKIGITTTDNSEEGLQGSLTFFKDSSLTYITQDTPFSEHLFRETIERDEIGTNVEEPLAVAIAAMKKREGANSGFFRDDADLALVILSDEDERSQGHSWATSPDDVLNTFSTIWPNKELKVFGIIIEPNDRQCLRTQGWSQTAHYGTFVAELADQTDGFTGSICESDYSDTLSSIGSNVSLNFNSHTLAEEPIDGTLEIKMVPDHNIAWKVSGKVVTFAANLPVDTYLEFSYQVPVPQDEPEVPVIQPVL